MRGREDQCSKPVPDGGEEEGEAEGAAEEGVISDEDSDPELGGELSSIETNPEEEPAEKSLFNEQRCDVPSYESGLFDNARFVPFNYLPSASM